MMKWIAKIRPIQIKLDDPTIGDLPAGLMWVNAYFAVHVALSMLISEEDGDVTEMLDIAFTQELYDNLVYQAQYRAISGRSMASQLSTIEEIYRRRKNDIAASTSSINVCDALSKVANSIQTLQASFDSYASMRKEQNQT